MNDDFVKLNQEIEILTDLINVDTAILPSLKRQLNVIEKMLSHDKANIKSKYKSLKNIDY